MSPRLPTWLRLVAATCSQATDASPCGNAYRSVIAPANFRMTGAAITTSGSMMAQE
jgi:hypothetical protein